MIVEQQLYLKQYFMSFKRETFRHSAIYSIANVLGMLTSFIMLPFYAQIFETAGFGIIALIDSAVGFLAIAFANGSYQAMMKVYHEEPESRKSLVIGTGIWTVWRLGLICIPLPILASPWISTFLFDDSEYWPLIVLALITFIVSMGGKSASTFLVIDQRSGLYSFVNLLTLILGLTLNIVLVIYLQFGLAGIFISSLASNFVASLIFHWVAIWENGLHYDADIGLKLRKFWFPLIPGELFGYLSRQVERYLIRFFVSLEAVGILEMAYKFPPLINIFIAHPFQRAWGTKSLEIAPRADAPKEISSMFTFYVFLMLFMAVFLAANIEMVLAIMTPPEFWPAARLAQIDIITTVIASANAYLLFGLLYSGKTAVITRIRITVAVIKLGFSTILVMIFGLAGAVYSALVMEIIMLVWIFNKAQQAYWLPLEYRKIIALCGFAVGLVILADHLPQFASGVLDRVETSLFGNLLAFLADTPLGGWRSGKLIEVLGNRTDQFAKLLVSCCFCLLYGALILVVKPELARLDKIYPFRLAIAAIRRRKGE